VPAFKEAVNPIFAKSALFEMANAHIFKIKIIPTNGQVEVK
jgi:hypothetical protein